MCLIAVLCRGKRGAEADSAARRRRGPRRGAACTSTGRQECAVAREPPRKPPLKWLNLSASAMRRALQKMWCKVAQLPTTFVQRWMPD